MQYIAWANVVVSSVRCRRIKLCWCILWCLFCLAFLYMQMLYVFACGAQVTFMCYYQSECNASRADSRTWQIMKIAAPSTTTLNTVILCHPFKMLILITNIKFKLMNNRSSNPGRVKNFLFSTSPRSVLGSPQPPVQRVPLPLSPG
jgi:hypothetical protein